MGLELESAMARAVHESVWAAHAGRFWVSPQPWRGRPTNGARDGGGSMGVTDRLAIPGGLGDPALVLPMGIESRLRAGSERLNHLGAERLVTGALLAQAVQVGAPGARSYRASASSWPPGGLRSNHLGAVSLGLDAPVAQVVRVSMELGASTGAASMGVTILIWPVLAEWGTRGGFGMGLAQHLAPGGLGLNRPGGRLLGVVIRLARPVQARGVTPSGVAWRRRVGARAISPRWPRRSHAADPPTP